MTLFFLMCSSDWKYYKAGTHKKYITPVLHLASFTHSSLLPKNIILIEHKMCSFSQQGNFTSLWIVFSYYHIKTVDYPNVNHFIIFILLPWLSARLWILGHPVICISYVCLPSTCKCASKEIDLGWFLCVLFDCCCAINTLVNCGLRVGLVG